MIKPTVGRVVLFFQVNGLIPRELGKPLPALVVYVHSDALVNLAVFDMYGHTHPVTNCRLVQPEETADLSNMFCTWMPFQVGQAPGAQDVQRRLDEYQSRIGALEARLSGEVSPLAGSAPSSPSPLAPPLKGKK